MAVPRELKARPDCGLAMPCSDQSNLLFTAFMMFSEMFTIVYIISLLMFTVLTFYWWSLMPLWFAKMLWNGQHEVVQHFVMFVREQFCDDQRPVRPHSNQRDMAIRCFVATLASFFVVTSADEPEFRFKSVDVKWCEYVYIWFILYDHIYIYMCYVQNM